MKVIVLVTACIALTAAEPPAPSNQYLPSAYTSQSFPLVPSAHYSVPDDSAFYYTPSINSGVVLTPNSQYSVSKPNPQYGVPGASTNYGVPSVPTNYGVPSVSTSYGIPTASSTYGVPSVSTNYGVPKVSTSYSAPSVSTNYGTPSVSTNYGSPRDSNTYSTLSTSADHAPSLSNDAVITNYAGPNTYNTLSFSANHDTAVVGNDAVNTKTGSRTPKISSQYGAPQLSSNKGALSFGNGFVLIPNTEYGAPKLVTHYGTPAMSSYEAPSLTVTSTGQYGAPKIDSVYGVPVDSSNYGPSASGYSGSEEYQNHYEPANYNFKYELRDDKHGNDYGHEETRQGNVVQGRYHVLLPDGKRQIVEYTADVEGFKPRISYEQVSNGINGYEGQTTDEQEGYHY